jgi:hypothetical protein
VPVLKKLNECCCAKRNGVGLRQSLLRNEESSMTRWIATAMLALTVMFGSAAIRPAAAASMQPAAQISGAAKVADVSARRRIWHDHHYRYAYQPYYYDRPYYYAPAPFFPFFGLGYGPLW